MTHDNGLAVSCALVHNNVLQRIFAAKVIRSRDKDFSLLPLFLHLYRMSMLWTYPLLVLPSWTTFWRMRLPLRRNTKHRYTQTFWRKSHCVKSVNCVLSFRALSFFLRVWRNFLKTSPLWQVPLLPLYSLSTPDPLSSDEKLISIARGGTHKVMDSLTVVYGIVAQRSPSFQSVLKAALLGGDTDSNASMGKHSSLCLFHLFFLSCLLVRMLY